MKTSQDAILIAGGTRAKPGQKAHPADDDTAVVVTLGSPRLKDNGDVSFNVTVVPASTELSSGVVKNYLAAARGDKPPPAGVWTSLPASRKTLESVSLFVDDYYLEEPAAGAPPPPPPPPPPPASAFNNAAWDQRYQEKMWDRISGPQPIDAYGCGFTGGCGYGGYGGGGMFGVPSWG